MTVKYYQVQVHRGGSTGCIRLTEPLTPTKLQQLRNLTEVLNATSVTYQEQYTRHLDLEAA